MLVLVTHIMCKSLLLYVLGLLCIDNLTKCNTISIVKKFFEKLMSFVFFKSGFFFFIKLVHYLLVVYLLLGSGKLTLYYRTNSNTSKLIENFKAKRVIISKELGKLAP